MGTWLDGIKGVMTEEEIENEQTGNLMLLEYQNGIFWGFKEEIGNGFKVVGRPDDDGGVGVDLWGPDGLYLFVVEYPCLDDALIALEELMNEPDEDLGDCPEWYAPQVLIL